jgi:8-oxo-dGTP diphosphatase
VAEVPHREVVTSFLERDGKILLLRRSDRVRTYPGRWAGVSGSIDSGHTPEEQARVEILEETQLTGDDVRLIASGEPLSFDDAETARSWVVYPFRFEVLHPERIKTDWEHSESVWIEPERLGNFPTVPRLLDVWQRVAHPQR